MVNSSDFIERLEYLLQFYDLNASAFADKIQVQRSSISHLLSGRNKPSLEFVLKVVKNFPEVNLYWLLNGKGTFPSETGNESVAPPKESIELSKENALNDTPVAKSKPLTDQEVQKGIKKIQRIVIFYSDGSFEAYNGQ